MTVSSLDTNKSAISIILVFAWTNSQIHTNLSKFSYRCPVRSRPDRSTDKTRVDSNIAVYTEPGYPRTRHGLWGVECVKLL